MFESKSNSIVITVLGVLSVTGLAGLLYGHILSVLYGHVTGLVVSALGR